MYIKAPGFQEKKDCRIKILFDYVAENHGKKARVIAIDRNSSCITFKHVKCHLTHFDCHSLTSKFYSFVY